MGELIPAFSSHCTAPLLPSSVTATHLKRACGPHPLPATLCTSSMPPPPPPPPPPPSPPPHTSCQACTRRVAMGAATALSCAAMAPSTGAGARIRRKRVDIPLADYQTSADGLKFYDIIEGEGPLVQKGQRVLVHFDCIYRGIDVVSSRESKLLGGNRIIAQPYELTVGSRPGNERKREFVANANGLFSAQAAPKPPPALYSATEGMHVGGKRTVIVTAEAGYGNRGMNEIPPGATFQMDIELLEVKKGVPAK